MSKRKSHLADGDDLPSPHAKRPRIQAKLPQPDDPRAALRQEKEVMEKKVQHADEAQMGRTIWHDTLDRVNKALAKLED